MVNSACSPVCINHSSDYFHLCSCKLSSSIKTHHCQRLVKITLIMVNFYASALIGMVDTDHQTCSTQVKDSHLLLQLNIHSCKMKLTENSKTLLPLTSLGKGSMARCSAIHLRLLYRNCYHSYYSKVSHLATSWCHR